MPEALDRAVRFFVAEGSGLKREQVFEGDEDKLPRPPEPYATLLPGVNQRMGYPITYYYPATETTAQMVYRRQFYSLQFHRKGALAYAEAFDDWAQSENGLLQAETAFSDGRIAQIKLLTGGQGYEAAPFVAFFIGGGEGAQATAFIRNGTVRSVRLTHRGEGYADAPRIAFTTDGVGSGATATCIGFGFGVVFPLQVQQLNLAVETGIEKRGLINLGIEYRSFSVQNTGGIDTYGCEITYGNEVQRGTVEVGT